MTLIAAAAFAVVALLAAGTSDAVELFALLKAVAYLAPLGLLIRHIQWRWLTLGIVVLMLANAATAAGADRLTTQWIGVVFQVLLTLHIIDLSKYQRPSAGRAGDPTV